MDKETAEKLDDLIGDVIAMVRRPPSPDYSEAIKDLRECIILTGLATSVYVEQEVAEEAANKLIEVAQTAGLIKRQ